MDTSRINERGNWVRGCGCEVAVDDGTLINACDNHSEPHCSDEFCKSCGDGIKYYQITMRDDAGANWIDTYRAHSEVLAMEKAGLAAMDAGGKWEIVLVEEIKHGS